MSNVNTLVLEKSREDATRYTNRDIARATGLSEVMVSRIMRDVKPVDSLAVRDAKKLATWLNCHIEDLYTVVKD